MFLRSIFLTSWDFLCKLLIVSPPTFIYRWEITKLITISFLEKYSINIFRYLFSLVSVSLNFDKFFSTFYMSWNKFKKNSLFNFLLSITIFSIQYFFYNPIFKSYFIPNDLHAFRQRLYIDRLMKAIYFF